MRRNYPGISIKSYIAIQMHGGGQNSNPFISRIGARISAGMQAAGAPPLDRTIPHVFYHPEVLRFPEVVSLACAEPCILSRKST